MQIVKKEFQEDLLPNSKIYSCNNQIIVKENIEQCDQLKTLKRLYIINKNGSNNSYITTILPACNRCNRYNIDKCMHIK